jgi:4'-phosphopantetheinyl transferase
VSTTIRLIPVCLQSVCGTTNKREAWRFQQAKHQRQFVVPSQSPSFVACGETHAQLALAGPMTIDCGRVDLWCAYLDEIPALVIEEYRALLIDSERERAARFHFEPERRRYVVTRALVRTTLSRYAPIAPQEWAFSSNPYGRPEIATDDPLARRLSFNVSHTTNLVVLGVTCNRALGIDVEDVRSRAPAIEISDRFFSPAEVEDLEALPSEMKLERFFDYWTLKESYIKARGLGLSIPLDQFSFHFSHGRSVGFSVSNQLDDIPSRWHFWQLRPSRDYLIALCVQRTTTSVPFVRTRRVIPLHGEELIDCLVLRTSV